MPFRPNTTSWWLAEALAQDRQAREATTWPDVRWQDDILGFCRYHFGVDPWEKQANVLRAIQDGDRVAVASGRKIGKSFLVAAAALWYYSSFEDARVILMAPTYRQVETIVWREVRKLFKLARKRDTPLGGHLCARASSGLRAEDEREIRGFTADHAEDAAGVSGANMFFVFDEASGIDDQIYGAMIGNMAAGGKIAAMSNPTQTAGWFFDAFHDAGEFWQTFNISSEDTPNARAGKVVIKGLAGRPWIQEMRAEYGKDSAFYRMHVLGEFAIGEDARIVSLDTLRAATARWETTEAEGPLVIGLDPAEARDDSAFVAVRGQKMLRSWLFKRLTPEAHAVHLAAILNELRLPREEPVVIIDREGAVGAAVYGTLRVHAEQNNYRLVGVRSSDKSRQPKIYARVRDDLWAGLASWLQRGGAIPSDARLEKEVHAPDWLQGENGLMKATPKEKLRQILGNSPDVADALALAVWAPSREQYAPETPERGAPKRGRREPGDGGSRGGGLDPYSGGLDPYAA